ncbi:MAG: diguanylate cyclase [Humidesulfovibrio sp.]
MAALQGLPANLSWQLNDLIKRSATTCFLDKDQWETLAREGGDEIYAEALYRLSRLELPASEARETVQAILAHQEGLCRTMGRDVSLLTAMCDYFMQVNPLLREPILIEINLLRQREENAYRDELTGLLNRRAFNQEIPREMERFRRFGQPLSLLMLDLDHFKNFNDTYGHSAGDQVLRDTAQILGETARLLDTVIRYGGEEFAVILPQTTREEAVGVAERIRQAVQRHSIVFAGQHLPAITVSVGLACFPTDALDMASLVQRADLALYQAKVKRNCVCAFSDHQRNHTRYTLSDPLPLRLSDDKNQIFAVARDISFGGLLCETDRPIARASNIDLVLTDSVQGIRLPVSAQVSRVLSTGDGGYHLGLSFQLPSLEDQKTLMALIEGRTKPAGHCFIAGHRPPAARP